ncbi:MAG TPA: aldo/keto reductase [Acidimicrobiales bacterium]|nr:aldo/keto reductase [Acidimicrobiales bacterium]
MDFVMPIRQIGSLDVSLVGLGCNNFGQRTDEPASLRTIDAALDAGVNFFDTADVYAGSRSEEIVGKALRAHRDEVVIATKFGLEMGPGKSGAAPSYVKQAAEASLRRLGTGYIDLYQLHRPDPDVPIGETLGALDDLVREGKVREIGCSNFDAGQLRQAHEAAAGGAVRFASVQNEYSLLHREPEDGVLQECERLGIAFIPYFPLKSGLLSGKYRPGEPPPDGTRIAGWPEDRRQEVMVDDNFFVVARLAEWAQARGHTILELAFAWLAAKPAVVSVIAGATKPEQVEANAAAADWALSEQEVAEVDALLGVPGGEG